ncbi:Hsp33 family molecular chaperone HslO [Crenothrix polyspora]|uniref:33 kDa chaperonin n=1 Tax=Crenothrix polyspora TaxID=360316 RepID=A0A1R4H9U8_9GAMM|nr:Hsp33 family molecular chaperone HslO [Crenothrix polyspora]SJM92956.1 33 kDa chaperonin [Crenothrix polyspora]
MTQVDLLHRFLLEDRGIRGEWIQLTDSWQAIKNNHPAPAPAQQQLGHALAAVAMLSATIKFEGSLILQAQGDGAIRTLVAQATHDRKIRGLIRNTDTVPSGSLQAMFGQGNLALTIKPNHADPYQGIIALQGNNLATALESYFSQSEQLKTRLWLFANDSHAVGFLLQELPGNTDSSNWEHIEILANTLKEHELLTLDCQEILHRLFHEENLRLFDGEAVSFECVCSRARIESTLKSLGNDELQDILRERGSIEVGCEFCNTQHQFDPIDIARLFTAQDFVNSSTTRH